MNLLKEFLIKELNINDSDIFEKFELYNKYLLEWNSKINLISRQLTSIESNILNSIFFLSRYDITGSKNILDLGTGGGFPGIPLAILFKNIHIILNDSVRKKTNALEDMTKRLGLKNTEIVCGRAEELSEDKKYYKKYDFVVVKSVSALKNLYAWGNRFLKNDGKIICIKGGDMQKEIKEFGGKVKIGIINFDFEEKYKIEDKKIVILNSQQKIL